jgi:hypothetical protein
VYSTKFGFHHARTGHTNEQIVLSVFYVPPSGGGGEIDGAAHIEAFVGTGVEHIRLDEPKLHRRKNRGGGYRFCAEYSIPDDPRVPEHLRGDRLWLRLDTTDADREAGIARAENLRPIAQGDERWETLNASRPVSESFNAWLKSTWRNGRAPAVGKGRQHLRLIYASLRANFIARFAFERRTSGAQGDPPLPVAA